MTTMREMVESWGSKIGMAGVVRVRGEMMLVPAHGAGAWRESVGIPFADLDGRTLRIEGQEIRIVARDTYLWLEHPDLPGGREDIRTAWELVLDGEIV